MKSFIVASTILSLAVANSIATRDDPCACDYMCIQQIGPDCECEIAAKNKCYADQQAAGLNCAAPTISETCATFSAINARAEEPTASAQMSVLSASFIVSWASAESTLEMSILPISMPEPSATGLPGHPINRHSRAPTASAEISALAVSSSEPEATAWSLHPVNRHTKVSTVSAEMSILPISIPTSVVTPEMSILPISMLEPAATATSAVVKARDEPEDPCGCDYMCATEIGLECQCRNNALKACYVRQLAAGLNCTAPTPMPCPKIPIPVNVTAASSEPIFTALATPTLPPTTLITVPSTPLSTVGAQGDKCGQFTHPVQPPCGDGLYCALTNSQVSDIGGVCKSTVCGGLVGVQCGSGYKCQLDVACAGMDGADCQGKCIAL